MLWLLIESVDHFCYRGSFLSNIVSADTDIMFRLAKASRSSAFGKLQRRLWGEHGISLKMKVAVYRAVLNWHHFCMPATYGLFTDAMFLNCISSTFVACEKLLELNGRIGLPMLKYCRPVKFQAWKHFCYKRNTDGPGTLYECQITASQSRYSAGNWNRECDCHAARQTAQGHSQDQPQAVWNQSKPAKQRRTEPIILAFGVSSLIKRLKSLKKPVSQLLNASKYGVQVRFTDAMFLNCISSTFVACEKLGLGSGSHVGIWPCDSCSRICIPPELGYNYVHQRTHR